MAVHARPGRRFPALPFPHWAPVRNAAVANALLHLLLVSVGIRGIAAIFFSGAIETEGAEYARIAQNLIAGHGYQGIAEEGTQLFFPPLYPLAIAGLSLLTGDAEIAGRMLSVLLGGLIVVPVYFIAARMYGRKTGLVAAALVGLHPYLIDLSTTVQSEATYLTLVLSAIALAFAAIAEATPRNALATGAAYGLAYLVRPEAMVYMLISVALVFLCALCRQRRSLPAAAGSAALVIAAFALLAAPYAGWLTQHTGAFRLEGKSPLNIETVRRIQLGENPTSVQFGIDASGNETGVWNRPNIEVIREYSRSPADIAALMRKKTKEVFDNAGRALASTAAFGSPALFALAILGFFARPWSLTLATCQLQLVAVLALSILGTYFIYYTADRFYVLLVPFLAIWAAAGLRSIALWATGTAFKIGLPGPLRVPARSLAVIAALAAVFIPSALAAATMLKGARETAAVKRAAEQIGAASRTPLRVLDTQTTFAFHAGAVHVWMPYADEAAAIAYLQKKNVDLVVVRRSEAATRPYLKKWAETGPPLPGAKLVDKLDLGSWETILIYRMAGDRQQ